MKPKRARELLGQLMVNLDEMRRARERIDEIEREYVAELDAQLEKVRKRIEKRAKKDGKKG